MAEYTFVRRYDTPIYKAFLVLFAVIAVAFAFAAMHRPVALAFCLLFAFGSWILYSGIGRGCTSGITVDEFSIRWHQTGFQALSRSVDLSSISRVERLHLDGDRVTLILNDNNKIQIEERFFGDGDALLNEIAARANSVTILDNGRPWSG
ncbi:hypothetical protein [Planctomycetes bacterium CA13]|uniref:hypothetical protein n=1 Tax=Novipirellula herctigrandis TaxID=2527986 RepID=UPI0011B6AA82